MGRAKAAAVDRHALKVAADITKNVEPTPRDVRVVISRQVQYVVVEVPVWTWWAPGQWCCEGAFTSEGVPAEEADPSPTVGGRGGAPGRSVTWR